MHQEALNVNFDVSTNTMYEQKWIKIREKAEYVNRMKVYIRKD
jgi:hypothetical protein